MPEGAGLAVVGVRLDGGVAAVAGQHVVRVRVPADAELLDGASGRFELGITPRPPTGAWTGCARWSEHGVGFVDQREVGLGPRDGGDVGDSFADEKPLLGVGEHTARR